MRKWEDSVTISSKGEQAQSTEERIFRIPVLTPKPRVPGELIAGSWPCSYLPLN